MALSRFKNLFGTSRLAVIGMIHVKSLPGTPRNQLSVEEIVECALNEAEIYKCNGVDGVLIENMNDLPYIQAKDFGPEVVAIMTRISSEIRKNLPEELPCGIQILAGGNKEALAVSKACGLQFIRCEGYVFSHVADEGWMDSCAGNLLRYRKTIECENVSVFVDIKKKHSAHAVTEDISLNETVKAAEFFLSDGVILTGTSTGVQADPQDLIGVKKVTEMPVLIGSGVTVENVEKFSDANGVIVGSHFKDNGKWNEKLNPQKIEEFVKKVKEIRLNPKI